MVKVLEKGQKAETNTKYKMMYTHISKNHLSGEMPDRTLQGAARRKDIQRMPESRDEAKMPQT